jgi:hypothetical protein
MKNDPQDFHFHLNTLLRRATGRFPADDLDAEIGAITPSTCSKPPSGIDFTKLHFGENIFGQFLSE